MNMENNEEKITIHFYDICDVYDICKFSHCDVVMWYYLHQYSTKINLLFTKKIWADELEKRQQYILPNRHIKILQNQRKHKDYDYTIPKILISEIDKCIKILSDKQQQKKNQ